ncbi:MAG: right-handed parallel beta-helix repeat-containing protein [bacterium]
MRSRRFSLAIPAASLLVASAAGALTHHVPSEYATINAALDASVSGDSVLVAPGTYSQYEVRVLHGGGPFTASSVAFLKAGVSLIGEGGRDVTRIDLAGQGVGCAVPVLAYGLGPGTILIQGFTVTGAPVGSTGMWSRFMDRMIIRACRLADLDGGTAQPGGLYSETVALEIYDTEFRNCRIEGGPYRQAAILHAEGDAVLDGCLFADCAGPDIVWLDALGLDPAFGALVKNCEFRNNAGLGARLGEFVDLTVEDCRFVGNHPSANTSALVVFGGQGVVEPGPYHVRRNLFADNESALGWGTIYWDRVSGVFEQNTLVGNGTNGLVMSYSDWQHVTLQNNIFSSTVGSTAVLFMASTSPVPVSACNDFWDNPGGNIAGYPPGVTDIFVDPQFCHRETGDYTLSSSSPCAPPQSGACGQIGALGEGCNGMAAEPQTWGRLKAAFR